MSLWKHLVIRPLLRQSTFLGPIAEGHLNFVQLPPYTPQSNLDSLLQTLLLINSPHLPALSIFSKLKPLPGLPAPPQSSFCPDPSKAILLALP